ncbi:unnamed protein product [Caenorhabditis angaria]|uniref:Serpentine Receptor, class H n=1 Tax=Caenorhabditis angaria TaxID=860376 RepID=A0A9P1ITF6_9PELO|nr:unnamed protein product [Caenorhabditis angaria]
MPISVYALYCVIFVTPITMKNARRHLINLHFWTMFFDLVYNLLIIPMLFLPTSAIVVMGYGYNFGIAPRFCMYFIQAIVSVITAAIIGLFENRFSSITTNQFRLENNYFRTFLYIFNYCVACLTVIPPYLKSIDTNSIRLEFLQIFPCPPDVFFTDRLTVVTDDPTYATIFMSVQTIILVPQSVVFTLYTTYLLFFRPNQSVSEATRKMQINFLIAVCSQCFIPLGLLMFPVFYVWFSTWTNYYNAVFNNQISVMVSLHGLLSTLCLLLIHKPYRQHFLSLFRSTLQLRTRTSNMPTRMFRQKTTSLDIIFNVLIIPVVFLPAISISSLGYGYDIGISARYQIYLIQSFVCVICSTMIGLFENRFSSISTNPFRIRKKWIRVLLYIFDYCVAFITVIPPYLKSIDYDLIRLDFLEKFPCPPNEFFSDRFGVVSDDAAYVTIFMSIQFWLLAPQLSFFTLYTVYLLIIRPNVSVSESTRKMQITFLISVYLQCIIPVTFLAYPVFYIWFSVWTKYYSAANNNHIVAMVSLHGFLSTLCLLLVHKPYRTHLISIFKIRSHPTIFVSGVMPFRTMVFDLVYNMLIIPILFLPTTAVVIMGYGYDFGIPPKFCIYFIQAIVSVIAAAIIGLFENRFSTITTNKFRLKNNYVKAFLYIFNYCVACLTVIPPYLKSIDTNSIRFEFLQISPCPPQEFFTNRLTVITDDPSYVTIFMSIQSIILIPQCAVFTLYTTYLLVFKPSQTVSEATRKIQITFLIAVYSQCFIPFGLLMLPVIYVWFSAWTKYYNAAFNNHISVMVSLHGLLSTLCLLLIHKTFRQHFLSLFWGTKIFPISQSSSTQPRNC